jgi:hypothetical protein
LKKIIFTISLLCLTIPQLFPQGNYGRVQNLVHVDEKRYHFGFILGLNAMDVNVTNAGIVDNNGRIWYAEQTSLSPGFTVGMITDLRIFEYLNLRFTPALLFGDRTLTFIDQDRGNAKDVVVRSNLINFPLLFKFRGQRYVNHRPYLLGGASATLDLGRQRENVIMLKQMDYGIEFGVGFDLYLPYFKLAPELKMYLGFADMLERDRPEIENYSDLKYTNAISKLTSRLFILSFNFE